MEDLRQSKEYGRFMELMGWKIRKNIFIKKLPVIPFRIAKWQRPSELIDFFKLERIVHKNKINYLIVEPGWTARQKEIERSFKKNGFSKNKLPMLPTKTIWLDLKKSESQLLKETCPKTRYNIKKHKRGDVKIMVLKKVDEQTLRRFFEIYRLNCKRQKYWGMSFDQLKWLREAFYNKAYLLWLDGLGGLIMLIHDKVAYYSHNAASKQGKKEFVPTVLTWEAIKLAKRIKCKVFDFEGVNDERFKITKKWLGFSRFKKGFGGKVIEYRGSFSKFYWRHK